MSEPKIKFTTSSAKNTELASRHQTELLEAYRRVERCIREASQYPIIVPAEAFGTIEPVIKELVVQLTVAGWNVTHVGTAYHLKSTGR